MLLSAALRRLRLLYFGRLCEQCIHRRTFLSHPCCVARSRKYRLTFSRCWFGIPASARSGTQDEFRLDGAQVSIGEALAL